jgi:hypothetical protein
VCVCVCVRVCEVGVEQSTAEQREVFAAMLDSGWAKQEWGHIEHTGRTRADEIFLVNSTQYRSIISHTHTDTHILIHSHSPTRTQTRTVCAAGETST